MVQIAALLLVALPLFVVAGCDQLSPATPIKEVLAAPAGFEGREIRLKGRVKEITKIPLIDLKAYTLADETGEIAVITEGALPAQGADVRLTGRVESAAIIGGQSLGLRVKEIQRN